MRKDRATYMLYMSDTEKAFIEEMAWRKKLPMAQYIKRLIRNEMEKNPQVVEMVQKKVSV